MDTQQTDLFTEVAQEVAPAPPTLTLRPYQQQALDKLLWSQSVEGNDLCVLPTGSGKSVVIAHLAKALQQPILILQPSKEILEQNYKKLCHYVDPHEIGIYSASLKEKRVNYYTFATIQSIYKKPEEFRQFKTVLIDECHLVNPKNLEGMFTQFLKAMGQPKVVGFTATPYRMGMAYTFEKGYLNASASIKLINRMKERFWHRIVFNINNHELLEQEYLAPLEYIDRAILEHDEIPVNKSESDFDLGGYERAISKRQREIATALDYANSVSSSVLVFCSSVNQATTLSGLMPGSAVVTGETPIKEREAMINGFKDGTIKTIFNVGVLTTGFDHPALDGIVLLRPTRSIALYYQMLGRGVRPAPGKSSCKVIDLTSTVRNLGRVETIKLVKVNGMWELVTEAGSWHNRQLYRFSKKIECKVPKQAIPETLGQQQIALR